MSRLEVWLTLNSEVLKLPDSQQLWPRSRSRDSGSSSGDGVKAAANKREDIARDQRWGYKSLTLHHLLTCAPHVIRHADGKIATASTVQGRTAGPDVRKSESWAFPSRGCTCCVIHGSWWCVLRGYELCGKIEILSQMTCLSAPSRHSAHFMHLPKNNLRKDFPSFSGESSTRSKDAITQLRVWHVDG